MNKKRIVTIIVIIALIGGEIFGGIKYNQHLKEKALLEEQARIEAEKQALEEQARLEAEEQARKIGTYKAEAREYYDEHERDFIFADDLTKDKFIDDYVALRQADKTQDEAIESIRSSYWVVNYFEQGENVYVSVEDGAEYYNSPKVEESLGTFDYCSEHEAIGLAEKYNEQKQMKEVMYLFEWDEEEVVGQAPEGYEPKIIHVKAVSNIANFTTEITEQMQARLDAMEEENAIIINSIDDIFALGMPDGTAETQDPKREVPFVPGSMTDSATGKTISSVGGYNGNGYYGNNMWVYKDSAALIICNSKDGYEEVKEISEGFASGKYISDEEASQRAADAAHQADPSTDGRNLNWD